MLLIMNFQHALPGLPSKILSARSPRAHNFQISPLVWGLSDVENLRKLTPHLRCQAMNPKVKETLNSIGSILMRRSRFGELKATDSVSNSCVLAEKLII